MDKLIELLSNPSKANVVMQTLASYVVYVYPGIASIYFYNFFNARTTKHTQAFVIKSFAISFLYNVCLKKILLIITCIKEKPNESSMVYNFILITIAFLVPYCCYKFKMSQLFANICSFFGISTSATNVPFELLGDKEEQFTCLKIYLKDEPYVYIGYLGEYEYEEGHEKYAILTGYKKYFIESDSCEQLISEHDSEKFQEKVFIRYDDIKLIEKIEENRAKEDIYKEKHTD